MTKHLFKMDLQQLNMFSATEANHHTILVLDWSTIIGIAIIIIIFLIFVSVSIYDKFKSKFKK